MKNGNISDFIEILYYGGELFFEHNNVKYFIQGWNDEGSAIMVLDRLTPTAPDYLWKCIEKNMIDCAKKFLNEPIFDGKTFWNVEKDITWVDC